MNEYDKLVKEFENKVRELQKSCPHPKITKWFHETCDMTYTNFDIQKCERCNKIVLTKRPCMFCKKMLFSEDRWNDRRYNFRWGWFCSEECHQKYAKAKKEWEKKMWEEINNAEKEGRMPCVIVKEEFGDEEK